MGIPASKVIEGFLANENKLREAFVKDTKCKLILNPFINIIPVFTGIQHLLTTCTHSMDPEYQYIFPLGAADRKPPGSPTIVDSIEAFCRNFDIFTEGSLRGLHWSNLVVAGGAVTNCLLPPPLASNASDIAFR